MHPSHNHVWEKSGMFCQTHSTAQWWTPMPRTLMAVSVATADPGADGAGLQPLSQDLPPPVMPSFDTLLAAAIGGVVTLHWCHALRMVTWIALCTPPCSRGGANHYLKGVPD